MGLVPVVFIGLVGTALASFLATLSYRSGRGLSILSPPSFCPGCRRRLGFVDLLPVVGYLLSRGRCRVCGYRIPVQYLCGEIALPALYVGVYLMYGFAPQFFVYVYLIGLLLYLSLVDLDLGTVSAGDISAVYTGGIAVLCLVRFRLIPGHLLPHLYGFAATGVLLCMSVLLVYVRKKVLALGYGDLCIVPGIALYFSLLEDIRILVCAALAGIAVGIPLILIGRVRKDFKFPMIPFVMAGVCIEIFLF
jgi:prepilin signal peptidase PulO-like enzyme (type II secretory pathway)